VHHFRVTTFAESIARVLHARAGELAARWRVRATAATPRPPSATSVAGEAESVAVARALIACLHTDARCLGEVMRLGWADGAAAQAAGLGVHHVVKDADLLLAILLTAAEESTVGELAETATPSDAFSVARRLQRAASLYGQSAASSYLHALVGAVRARWRLLRHDLRNPLGTIRSALSLMEDETVPQDARSGPRVRAMMARNAGSLEELIAAQLDDRIAESLLAAPQEVSLRDVALAVRRTLRESASLADCEIVVDDGLPAARVDGAAAELTLSTLLLAAITSARPGDVLHVRPHGVSRDGRTISLCIGHDSAADDQRHVTPDDMWDADGMALALALAAEYGGRITRAAGGTALDLELPILPPIDAPRGGPARRASTASPPRVSVGHQRDDVPRAD
jgi:signal transduction histidine kinase